jgi:hypothetical protein
MQTGGTMPAGSGRGDLRLDPFALPVTFPAHDAGADGEVRQVELDRDRIVIHRTVRGIPMSLRLPMQDFEGVTLRLVSLGDEAKAVAVIAEHRDPSLSLVLHVVDESEDIVPLCKAWCRVLRLPLLTHPHSRPRKAILRLGALRVGVMSQRRKRRAAIRQRRPAILMRRKTGRALHDAATHRGEREIIARN